MTQLSRVNDIGIGTCPIHGETVVVFVSGADSVLTNNLPSCIVTTVGICMCGHTSVAQSGSSLYSIESKPAHRVNDMGEIAGGGIYVAVSGSPDVIANDG